MLLSSHLLREVEVIADHLVIINAGRIVADGTRSSFVPPVRRWSGPSTPGCCRTPCGRPGGRTAGRDGRRIAARAGAVLTEVRPQGNDLEDLFFTLTASDHEEAA